MSLVFTELIKIAAYAVHLCGTPLYCPLKRTFNFPEDPHIALIKVVLGRRNQQKNCLTKEKGCTMAKGNKS